MSTPISHQVTPCTRLLVFFAESTKILGITLFVARLAELFFKLPLFGNALPSAAMIFCNVATLAEAGAIICAFSSVPIALVVVHCNSCEVAAWNRVVEFISFE